jgi:adenylosuccinate lyase
MIELFSEEYRALLWRDLWIILAEEERRLGLPIRADQIRELKKARDRIDLRRVREWEKQLRHDVMSHVKAFGEQAPRAEGIIHLGATSCYVTDNADVLILKQASEILLEKLMGCLQLLESRIETWRDLPATGFTHFQPAQPVTVGKRLCLWAQDLMWDYEELHFALLRLRPLGCKGATGTQFSFMELFKGDYKKVRKLDEAVSQRMGFDQSVAVSGQTLSRKVDSWFLLALSQLASSLSKISYDLRLLQHLGEMRESFGDNQIGSSAMPYKRNPVLAERMTSLSRFLMTIASSGPWTHGTQWLERSLDDSAIRRIALPEAFLAADSLLEIGLRAFSKIELDEPNVRRRFLENARYFQTERQMMRGSLKGKSRQALHEEFRQQSLRGDLEKSHDVESLVGAAPIQAKQFLDRHLRPFLKGQSKKFSVRLQSTSAEI